jgi:hypothetical protein
VIAQILPLRHNALKPELAGVMEGDRPVLLEGLVEPQAGSKPAVTGPSAIGPVILDEQTQAATRSNDR